MDRRSRAELRANGAKKLRITHLREALRASLWFVPAVSSVVAFATAKLLVVADRRLDPEPRQWLLIGGDADGAREVLSTVSSSMMTFTGLVFSITILVLQLASSQFSPRVLRTFLEDRMTKRAMAVFVGTFVFALAVLPEVRAAPDRFVPKLSLLVAFVLVLVSVGVFIRYIDHMAHSIRAVSIIKRVAAEASVAIDEMYPDVGEDVPEVDLDAALGPPDRVVTHSGRPGILSAIDEAALMEVAIACDVAIALVPMHGDFIPRDGALFRIWGTAAVDENLVRKAILVEDERTPHQDPAFGFRQLVDIAERALSPGINDPSTAVQALDEIHDLLRRLSRRRFPSPYRRGPDGRVRVILPRPDWATYVRLSLDEIRQFGGRSIQVVRRMRALILDCMDVAPPARRPILEEQLRLLDETTKRELPSRVDREIARRPSVQGHGQA